MLISSLEGPYSGGAINDLAIGAGRSAQAQGPSVFQSQVCSKRFVPGVLMTASNMFHPAVAAWFERAFAIHPSGQAQAWPRIQ